MRRIKARKGLSSSTAVARDNETATDVNASATRSIGKRRSGFCRSVSDANGLKIQGFYTSKAGVGS